MFSPWFIIVKFNDNIVFAKSPAMFTKEDMRQHLTVIKSEAYLVPCQTCTMVGFYKYYIERKRSADYVVYILL